MLHFCQTVKLLAEDQIPLQKHNLLFVEPISKKGICGQSGAAAVSSLQGISKGQRILSQFSRYLSFILESSGAVS